MLLPCAYSNYLILTRELRYVYVMLTGGKTPLGVREKTRDLANL